MYQATTIFNVSMSDALAITTAPVETHDVRVSVDLAEIQKRRPKVTGIQDCVRNDITGIAVSVESISTLIIQGPVSVGVDRDGYVVVSGVSDPQMNVVLKIGRLLIQKVLLDGREINIQQSA